ITAHKSQGKTLQHTVVNLRQCSGTEAPYVMISRVTSLEGLLILNSFRKERITCRQSEEVRNEAKRHEILALHTIVEAGSLEEVEEAKFKLQQLALSPVDLRNVVGREGDETHLAEDSFVRLTRLERANLMAVRASIAPLPSSRSTRVSLALPKRVPCKSTSGTTLPRLGMVLNISLCLQLTEINSAGPSSSSIQSSSSQPPSPPVKPHVPFVPATPVVREKRKAVPTAPAKPKRQRRR
ncbi:hypothetical protein B0H17DRAFT_959645, partial [Mycena rosella]